MGGGGEVAFGWHGEFRGWRAVGWKGGFGLFGLLGGKVVVCGELWTLDQEGILSCGASLLSVRGDSALCPIACVSIAIFCFHLITE